jgi:hypothetical protein
MFARILICPAVRPCSDRAWPLNPGHFAGRRVCLQPVTVSTACSVEEIPRIVPHTRSTEINQTNSKQHDWLINQINTVERYGTCS